MHHQKVHLLAALAAFVLGTTAAVATPGSASMNFGVFAQTSDGISATDSASDSWSGVPTGLSASASASAFSDDLHHGSVFGNGTASFAADGNSGTFTQNWGWAGVGVSELETNLAFSTGDWTYTFTSDVTGSFVLNYNVVGSGDTFGLQQIYLSDNFDSQSGVPGGTVFDPTASGTIVGSITAGQTYTVALANYGNVGAPGGFDQTGSAAGTFDWHIEGVRNVPDTGATAAFLGLAFAGLAFVRRRS